MGLITSLHLSNFTFHLFELSITSSARLQHRFLVLRLEWVPVGFVVVVTDTARRWSRKEVAVVGLRELAEATGNWTLWDTELV